MKIQLNDQLIRAVQFYCPLTTLHLWCIWFRREEKLIKNWKEKKKQEIQ